MLWMNILAGCTTMNFEHGNACHKGGLSGTKSVSPRLAATACAPQPQPLQQELEGLQTSAVLGDTGTKTMISTRVTMREGGSPE